MKGATAELCENIIMRLSTSNITIIGVIHHFFLDIRNCHSSFSSDMLNLLNYMPINIILKFSLYKQASLRAHNILDFM